LVSAWQQAFAPYALQVAPLVVSAEVSPASLMQLRDTIQALLRFNVIPLLLLNANAASLMLDLSLDTLVTPDKAVVGDLSQNTFHVALVNDVQIIEYYQASRDINAVRQNEMLARPLCGQLTIDNGAEQALRRGKSLSPLGVREVLGEFRRGDMVMVVTSAGDEIGRGLVAYSSTEARRIMGRQGGELETLLGEAAGRDVLIHRDDLVII
jgi:glutamate 5-kinase